MKLPSSQLLVAACLLLIILESADSICAAQADETSRLQSGGASSASEATAPSDYVLGGGDQVVIHVQDMDEIPASSLRIDPDGGLDLPLIGRVQATGLTLQQFKAVLTAKLSKYINSPQVAVNLTENQSRTVSVIGEVNSPGIHPLPRPRTLIEVISLAGGVKPDAGSKVVLTRELRRGSLPLPETHVDASGRYTTASLSLDNILSAKHPAENILIEPGDIVSIPKGEIVYVVGNVHRPGGFPLTSHESITLLQAVSLAEGLAPNAATKDAKILRPIPGSEDKPREIPVNVKEIFAGRAPDVPLYANDVLFIPNSAAKSGSRKAAETVLQVITGVAIYSR
ncbi:polysaccharide export outer membrane protein [Silvibacterium bohemicum]|uniref:Polysaccharide export outer membrane protein n=1 Tax=Silvibacterium bohemicum TaxID=1577686 RepID=A0A841JRA3_9BACT|nr:polysaccharide export outer membrane protein [Silvibacterium bohemicum]